MASTVASLSEVQSAQRFLRLIGAPTANNLLTLAVVAWMRVAGALWNSYTFAQRLLSGVIYKPIDLPRGWEHEETIANREAQLVAAQFQLMLNAARNGRGADFLLALSRSSWDPTRYTQAALLAAYSKFTGLTLPTPAATPPPPPPPPPTQPRPLLLTVLKRDYLEPYAGYKWYRARQRALPSLPGEPPAGSL